MSTDTHDHDDEPPLVCQFVGRMAGVWEDRFSPDREQLAGAMLTFAVNVLLEAHDEKHVAGLLIGIGTQIAREPDAGNA